VARWGPFRCLVLSGLVINFCNKIRYNKDIGILCLHSDSAQYGTHHVDTNGKKAELFRRGLSLLIQDCLVRFQDMPFNTLVSVVIAQDGTYRALLAEKRGEEKDWLVRTFGGQYCGCSTEVPPSLHSICWQVTSATSITPVGSRPASATNATSDAYPDSAVAGVIPVIGPVSSTCITSCASVGHRSRQRPVFKLWTCRALCLAMSQTQEG
jgi:hypothetical protein